MESETTSVDTLLNWKCVGDFEVESGVTEELAPAFTYDDGGGVYCGL
jgi:hypothetical protein